jgi:hypothetical protein
MVQVHDVCLNFLSFCAQGDLSKSKLMLGWLIKSASVKLGPI